MKKKELTEILAEHAEALVQDKDIEAQVLNRYPADSAELKPLFRLADAIKGALTPVASKAQPTPLFKAQLKQGLISYGPAEIVIGASVSRQRMMWLLVASAGSLLSIAGVVLLLIRRVRGDSEQVTQTATTTA